MTAARCSAWLGVLFVFTLGAQVRDKENGLTREEADSNADENCRGLHLFQCYNFRSLDLSRSYRGPGRVFESHRFLVKKQANGKANEEAQ